MFKTMLSWWRTHWRLGLVLVATGAGLLLLLFLWISHKNKEAERLRSQLALMATSVKVAGLEADKKARQAELAANSAAAQTLDKKILEAKKQTVALVQAVDQMTDAEVLAAFKKLGY